MQLQCTRFLRAWAIPLVSLSHQFDQRRFRVLCLEVPSGLTTFDRHWRLEKHRGGFLLEFSHLFAASHPKLVLLVTPVAQARSDAVKVRELDGRKCKDAGLALCKTQRSDQTGV